MKTSWFKKLLSSGVLLGLLAGMLVLAVPAQTVYAQDDQPPAQGTPSPEEKQEKIKAKLEELYQREQELLKKQTERLARVDERPAKIQARIDKLKAAGKDTKVLEDALAFLKGKLAEAHKAHDNAAAILSTHAGFDANGKVTDVQQAKETLRSAGEAARSAQKAINEGLERMRDAWSEFFEKNPRDKDNGNGNGA